jgi:hypothetical protein
MSVAVASLHRHVSEYRREHDASALSPASDRRLQGSDRLAECAARRAYVEDYDRIRETMSEVLDGFEDFNRRARHPHGFRLRQPARERVFGTPSGRAEFSLAPLPDDVDPGHGRLMLTTLRSHDQSTPRSTQTTIATEASKDCGPSSS